jgi:hypothetical protein
MLGAGGLVVLVGSAAGLRAEVGGAALQLALWSLVCGLAGYLFYSLGLPGSSILEGMTPGLRGLLIGFGFGLLPLFAVAWLSVREASTG